MREISLFRSLRNYLRKFGVLYCDYTDESVKKNLNDESFPNEDGLIDVFKPLLVEVRAVSEPRNISSASHYNDPIPKEGWLHGATRSWGDAGEAAQAMCAGLAAVMLLSAGYTDEEVAYALLLIRVESGFNPDAAAISTSASGLAQFIDFTRTTLAERIGLNSQKIDIFCPRTNILLLIATLKEQFQYASSKEGNRYLHAYDYHHDGPNRDYGGEKIAAEHILPRMETAVGCVNRL